MNVLGQDKHGKAQEWRPFRPNSFGDIFGQAVKEIFFHREKGESSELFVTAPHH